MTIVCLSAEVRTDFTPPPPPPQAAKHILCAIRKKYLFALSVLKKKKSAIFILKLNFWTITAHVRNILFTYPCPGMLSIKLYDGTCSKQKQSIIHNHLSLLHPGCWACFPVLLHQTDTSRQALMSLELCIQTKQWECTWNKVVSAAMRIMSSLQSGYWVLCINRKLKLKLMALDAFFFSLIWTAM